MSQYQSIAIKDFRPGLITDRDSTDQPLGSASIATNVTFESQGFVKKTRGVKAATLNSSAIPSLPSGFVPERGIIYRVRKPSKQDVTVLFGAESGRDRFYMTPHYGPVSASWDQTSWLELTEVLSTKVDTFTSATNFSLIAGDVSSTSNYYNKWYIQAWDRSAGRFLGWDIVLSYNGTTKVVTLKYGFPPLASGDDIVLSRYPIFDRMSSTVASGNYDITTLVRYKIDSVPDFQVFGDALYIYTGSGHGMGSNTGFTDYGVPDLWLGYINVAHYFNDTDLAYNGFQFEFAHARKVQASRSIAASPTWLIDQSAYSGTVSGTSAAFPYDSSSRNSMAVQVVGVYDGFQESNIPVEGVDDSVTLDKRVNYNFFSPISSGDNQVSINLTGNPCSSTAPLSDWEPDGTYTQLPSGVLSRRITSFAVYMSEAYGTLDTSSASAKIASRATIKSPFYKVIEIPVADSSATWWFSNTPSVWATGTAYSIGDIVAPTSGNETGFAYYCYYGGTSHATTEPSWSTTLGNTNDDNGVKWMCFTRTPYYDNLAGAAIPGDAYIDARIRELTSVRGYGHQNTGVTADFASRAGGNYVIGPFNAKEQVDDGLVIAPIAGAFGGGRITPSVLPVQIGKFSIFLREQGINKIVAHTEHQGRLVVFGENSFAVVILDGENSYIREHPSQHGLTSKFGYQVIDSVLYFCSYESIYAFDGTQVIDIGERIKSDWRDDFTDAQKEAAFMGHIARRKVLLIHVGSTIFSYDTLRKSWSTESSDKTWLQFIETYNKLIGLDSTGLWEIDTANFTVARPFTWRSNAISGEFDLNVLRFFGKYRSDDTITINFYDGNISTTQPIKRISLPSNTVQKDFEVPVPIRSSRLFIEATTSSTTNETVSIGKLEIGALPKGRK